MQFHFRLPSTRPDLQSWGQSSNLKKAIQHPQHVSGFYTTVIAGSGTGVFTSHITYLQVNLGMQDGGKGVAHAKQSNLKSQDTETRDG